MPCSFPGAHHGFHPLRMRRPRRFVAMLVRILVLSLALPSVPAIGAGEVARTTLDLEPRFSLGLDDEVLLGRPVDVERLDDGRFLVLDMQLAHVLVVDASGSVTGEIGREGPGPGELQSPFSMHLEPEGTIAVAQAAPLRLVRYAPDGTVLPDRRLDLGDGLRNLVAAVRDGERLVLEQATNEFDGQAVQQVGSLAILEPGRDEAVELARHASTIDLNRREFHEGDASPFSATWAVTTDGAVVWSSDLVEYRVQWYDPATGSTKTVARPDHRPVVRSDARREEVDERSTAAMRRGAGMEFEFVPLDHEPFLVQIHAVDDGGVWVRRRPESLSGYDPSVEPRALAFDHFDRTGAFVGEVQVRAPVWMADARVFLFGETLVAIHVPGEEEEADRPVTVEAFTMRAEDQGDGARSGAGRGAQ